MYTAYYIREIKVDVASKYEKILRILTESHHLFFYMGWDISHIDAGRSDKKYILIQSTFYLLFIFNIIFIYQFLCFTVGVRSRYFSNCEPISNTLIMFYLNKKFPKCHVQ